MKVLAKVVNGPMNKWSNFDGDPDHHLDTGIVFQIGHYWDTWKVVSTDCAARRCSARGIAIAAMTSLHLQPTWRRYALSQCFSFLNNYGRPA